MKSYKWIIFTGFGWEQEPYVVVLNNVNPDEIAICVQEQIYGGGE